MVRIRSSGEMDTRKGPGVFQRLLLYRIWRIEDSSRTRKGVRILAIVILKKSNAKSQLASQFANYIVEPSCLLSRKRKIRTVPAMTESKALGVHS